MLHRTYVLSFVTAVASARMLAQDLPESSPTALAHHAEGVAAYVKGNNADAIKHFRMAWETDPTSYASMLMAGVAAGNAGQGTQADSFYAMVAPHKDKLSAYYRYRLEAQMAGRAGDAAGVLAGNRAAAALGPGTKAHYNIAQAGAPRGLANEAREELRKLDPDKEPMKGWASYYSVYVGAAHALGDYADALAMARRSRVALPDNLGGITAEAEQLAALGHVADAEAVLAEIERRGPIGVDSPGEAYTTVGMELIAHGNGGAGKRALENAVRWYTSATDSAVKNPTRRANHAYALYNLGRYKDAAPIYASLIVDQPNNANWKGWSAYIAALLGDRATATATAQKFESKEIAASTATSLLWRALIATGLNDRARGLALFSEWGLKQTWQHRDPVMLKVYGKDLAEMIKVQ